MTLCIQRYERLQLSPIDWGERLSMALDCARGVACLHAQQPPIVHMDLKSANFLLGSQQVHKWTVRDVQQWLVGCRLQTFQSAFFKMRIDGEALIRHDEESLRLKLSQRLVRGNILNSATPNLL